MKRKLTTQKLKEKIDSLINNEGYDPNLINFSANLKREPMNKPNWSRIFDDALDSLSRDKDLRGVGISVLLQIMSRLDYENKIVLCQVEIAEVLGIDKAYISHSITKLVSKGILSKVGDVRRTHTYKLNIEYAWRGTAPNFNKEYNDKKLRNAINKDINKDASKKDKVDISHVNLDF